MKERISTDDNLSAALDDAIGRWLSGYSREVAVQIRRVLLRELTDPKGYSLPQLAKAVQTVSGFEDLEHAEQIGATLSYHAVNLANKRAWQQSGVVETLIWYAAEDDCMCEFCAALHKRTTGVDVAFLRAGDQLAGKAGTIINITDDVEAPPLHEGCRCYCRPESISSG